MANLRWLPISYPKSSGSLANGWSPGETPGNWNFITAVLWVTGILLPQYFCRKTMQAVTGQPIVIIKKSSSPQSLLATNRWPKRLRTLGTRLDGCYKD